MKANPLPSRAELDMAFSYDKESGEITYRRFKKGRANGYVRKDGYVQVKFKRRAILAHRVAWVLVNGEIEDSISIDHINGNRSDNRIANLRLASKAENMRNSGVRKNNVSGMKGVTYIPKNERWAARIRVNRRCVFLGWFSDPIAASEAYLAASKKYHGEFSIAARDA